MGVDAWVCHPQGRVLDSLLHSTSVTPFPTCSYAPGKKYEALTVEVQLLRKKVAIEDFHLSFGFYCRLSCHFLV